MNFDQVKYIFLHIYYWGNPTDTYAGVSTDFPAMACCNNPSPVSFIFLAAIFLYNHPLSA